MPKKECPHIVLRGGFPAICDRPVVDPVDEVCDRPDDHIKEIHHD